MALNKIKQGSIGQSAVTSDNIVDGTIVNADISPSAAIASSKAPGIATLCATATSINSTVGAVEQNIALLGFKMAVNDGLTVFNLVDGVVDEFHDESGTDESEGSNDHYCATNDVYSNNLTAGCVSAGFTTTAVTEADTSTAGTNPIIAAGTFGSFTVPNGMTSVNIFAWGAGGGGQGGSISEGSGRDCKAHGGGGGYSEGTLAVTPGQALTVVVGEGGLGFGNLNTASYSHGGIGGYRPSPERLASASQPEVAGGGGVSPCSSCLSGTPGKGENGHGGGLSGIFTAALSGGAPTAALIAGAGGGGTFNYDRPDFNPETAASPGGAGGGPHGYATGDQAQTNRVNTFTSHPGCTSGTPHGGGGSQTAGGQGGSSASPAPGPGNAEDGGLFYGGNNYVCEGNNYNVGSGGGAGYYGGGGGGWEPGISGGGGGGSSFIGHPQITSGSTEAGSNCEGGGTAIGSYVACTNEGGTETSNGEDGYMLLTGPFSAFGAPGGGNSTIISNPFAAGTVPTTSRIVVFEEDVQSPTLNTHIIASISRDGGSTFTTATLSDSGYVTGSSGQRILTGQATVSGQPSGQSMRWKLALATNTVKIHGVALQWS